MALSEGLIKEIGSISTLADAKEAWEFMRKRYNQLIGLEGAKFYVGQKVEFEAKGDVWKGVVERVNNKSLKVRTTEPRKVMWSVTPTVCRAI